VQNCFKEWQFSEQIRQGVSLILYLENAVAHPKATLLLHDADNVPINENDAQCEDCGVGYGSVIYVSSGRKGKCPECAAKLKDVKAVVLLPTWIKRKIAL
jgi:hypothetical protein